VNAGHLAIVGGTGALGRGLAQRALRYGVPVCIGSRNPEHARAVADELRARVPGAAVIGLSNLAAADMAEVVAITVPFVSQLETLRTIKEAVRGKIVIDTTVPLVPPKVARVQLPAEDSAAVRAQGELGAEVRLISAFHTIAASRLGSGASADDLGDVLVFGDDKVARESVVALLGSIGLRALHGGVLANSTAAEALTSVLIFMNKMYGADHAGVRIIGLPPQPGCVAQPGR
jgi:8-hydroxy-5-deazaflavin:NADPH oxidoreductase